MQAQCPSILCPADTVLSNDLGTCGTIVNYTVPIGTNPCAQQSQTFTFTGAPETWTVPAGVTTVDVDLRGAAGGGDAIYLPGLGGRLQATLPVIPGQVLNMYVGGEGLVLGNAGWNGGGLGAGGMVSNPGSGGGGASDIRIGGIALTDRVLVAGGGGGATENGGAANGGHGGGLIGADGAPGGNPWGCTPLTIATGGTQSAGGLGGTSTSCAWNGTDGSFGQGGDAYPVYRCAGGGGGYYGGGGAHNGCSGAGGSSFSIPTATNVIHTQGYNAGNGSIVISWVLMDTSLTTVQTAGLPSGAVFPVGITTNTYQVTDTMSNIATCSFTVTVLDTEAPTIISPADVTTCDSIVANISPSASDNCSGETVSFYTTGATSTSGTNDASGTTFNIGTTTVWYIVTDQGGNQDSSSFNIIRNPIPTVTIGAFNIDTVCANHLAVNLPIGTPASGTYTGPGVSGSTFDPGMSGVGDFWIVYTYVDTNSCSNSDSTQMTVIGCAGMDEELNTEWTIYPNPVSSQLYFSAPVKSALRVYNVSGQLILIIQEGSQEINVMGLSPGIYFIRGDSIQRKFIKL